LSMSDFREEVIIDKLSRCNYVLMVGAGKGGVGKSVISTLLALKLSSMRKEIFLLDLDLHGSSIPSLLGINYVVKESEKGFKPYEYNNRLEVMSLKFFIEDKPAPLRGHYKDYVIKEILTLTNWKSKNVIIDLPPGFSNELLTIIKLVRKANVKRGHLVITNPSIISAEVVRKYMALLKELGEEIIGLVINMAYMKYGNAVIRLGELRLGKEFQVLAELPYIPGIDNYLMRGVIPKELDKGLKPLISKIVPLF